MGERGRTRRDFRYRTREPFRKSRVGNECERMCECSQEEKKRTKSAKRASESRGIIKIGEGNVEKRWRRRLGLRTLNERGWSFKSRFFQLRRHWQNFPICQSMFNKATSTIDRVTIKALSTALPAALHPSRLSSPTPAALFFPSFV